MLASGRWHTRGRALLYASEHPAAALSEFLVHLDRALLPASFKLLELEVPDSTQVETLSQGKLPSDWTANLLATRELGNLWLHQNRSLVLKVPSVILPESWNYLVNCRHPDIGNLRLIRHLSVPLDQRL